MTNPLPDQWASRDLPVLRRIAELLEVENADEARPEGIASDLGMPEDDAIRSVAALHDSDYVKGVDAGAMGGGWQYVIATGLTERGRRELGMWPTPESTVARLTAAVDELLTRPGLAGDDRSRLAKVRDGLGGLSRDLAVDIGAAIITGRLPI